jgi:hypothetical protein
VSNPLDPLEALSFLRRSRTFINSRGYLIATDGATAKRYHRLLYMAHHGPIESNRQIHHIDGDKKNNSPNNLTALTPKEHAACHPRVKHRDERGRFVPKPLDP